MLTELCQEIRNWFVRSTEDQHIGTFRITGGAIAAPFLVSGQYYRIIGSIFNDGIHQYGSEDDGELIDESWTGAVWALAIALTRRTFDSKLMSLLFNMLSRLVITFLPKSKCLLILCL